MAAGAAVLAITGLVGVGAWSRFVPSTGPSIPTTRVKKGAVQVKVYTTGELRAARAAQLLVPPMGGSAQIVQLATSGQRVKAGEPVIEFDPGEQMFALEQSRFDLGQAEQEIVKAEAQAAVQTAEDEVALLHARFLVRRAELGVSANEFISAVEAHKNELLLAKARQQLTQIEKDVKSHAETHRAAASVLLEDSLNRFVKVNEQWFRVIGTVGPQAVVQADVAGLPAQDRNNLIYVPTAAAMFRLEDNYSSMRDEIDGVYLRLKPDVDVTSAATTVRGILAALHHGADDYTLVVPAELLAEQQRTKRIFDIVMVALASISLLVGGIGIMNIMLASVLERTPEIGLRRATGARKTDVIRQFVMETTLIAVVGGMLGLALGGAMSRLIASFAGWSTIVTSGSLLLAFSVSVFIGLVFGVYPAIKAASLDPVQALHYE